MVMISMRDEFINITRAKKKKVVVFNLGFIFGYGVSFDLCLLVYYYHDVCGFTISHFFFYNETICKLGLTVMEMT